MKDHSLHKTKTNHQPFLSLSWISVSHKHLKMGTKGIYVNIKTKAETNKTN